MNATYSTGNYWRYSRSIIAGVLAAVTMVILAAPAHADYVERFCGDSVHGVTLQAEYEIVYFGSGGRQHPVGRKWIRFVYRLNLLPWHGDQNNVDIRIYSNDGTIYEYKSPDNRKGDRWYSVGLDPNVVTLFGGGNYIGIQVVFDYTGWPDQTIACKIDPV